MMRAVVRRRLRTLFHAASLLLTLATAGSSNPLQTSSSDEVTALLARAKAALDRTNYREALPVFEQALAAAEREHEQQTVARSLRGLAVAQWGVGRDCSGLPNGCQRRATSGGSGFVELAATS